MANDYSERHPESGLYQEDTAKSILQIAEQEYQKEFERKDTLDAKATTLLGFSGVIASLVAGAGALALQSSQLDIIGTTRALFLGFYVAGVLFFVLAAVVCLMVFWPRKYEFVELEKFVIADKFKKSNLEFMVSASENFRNMKRKDKVKNDNKYSFLKWSFIFIGLGLLMVLYETYTLVAASIL